MMAAPLIIGTDIRKATPATMEILSNSGVIAVDQDPLGAQGTEISSANGLHVITKPLANGDRAVALFNETDAATTISTTASAVGLSKASGYTIEDLWAGTSAESAGEISAVVPPHGTAMFRVQAGGDWQTLPPDVHTGIEYPALFAGAPPLVEAGATTTVTTVTGNDGVQPARDGKVELTGPEGWTVRATSPTGFAQLETGHELSTRWSVTVPQGTPTGNYTLHVDTGYEPGPTTVGYDLTVSVVTEQPAGVSSLGDDQWVATSNGSGPVERNTSNGGSAAGDGGAITLNGQTFAKGLGTYAPSEVDYYLGGKCSTLESTVGLDELTSSTKGSVTFQMWADGKLVAETGVISRGDPPQQLTADVTGASLVKLVVTDAGDANTGDNGVWAGAEVTCA
jgi:alpha-galactosidase